MTEIVGIDLGTTNSLIGIMRFGLPLLFADENGARVTPSAVYFPRDGAPVIGDAALRARAVSPSATIYSVKRLMGARSRAIRDEHVDYCIVEDEGGWAGIRVHDRVISPQQVSSLILSKLKANAERALGHAVERAVITVPAYFNDAQRHATKRAGEMAGFTVERILNEPTAAALAYGLDRTKDKSKIAVYDFGGGTFDVSVLQLDQGVFEVLATNGNTHLGGDDIDQALIENCELPIPDWQKRELVISAKHELSSATEARIEVPSGNGTVQAYQLRRAELENLARPIVEKTRWHCERCLADAKLTVADLDEVILVGGATRMPIVRSLVAEIFQRQPNVSQSPEEAVALGATVQAGVLSGAVRDVVLLDVTPLSLGIETFGGLMNVIIPRNSTIPIKAGEMFTTAVNNQRAMSIKILQGEREMARDNWPLGQFNIEFEPAPKGVPRVGVQFEIDTDGILHVLARDTTSGSERQLELNTAVDVSDEAVEKMLGDSLEHAFEDMSERAWTEAKAKADEMLVALEEALPIAGPDLSPLARGRIEEARVEVTAAIAGKDLQSLQRANSALDGATQELAAIVISKAAANRESLARG